MSQTILLPTDGEPGADHAVEYALDLAETIGGTIHALYVVDESIYTAYAGDEYVREQESLETALEQAGTDALTAIVERAESRGIDVQTVQRHGKPSAEIVDMADEIDADLIVLGSKTRDGAYRQLLGSVSERVLRLTGRPVTVVKTPVETA